MPFTPHLKQLQVFTAVLRLGGTRQAAEAMNMSQPGVSMLLRDLQQNVGFTLFVRRNGRLIPTPEAGEFVERVVESLNSLERLKSFATDIKEMRMGSVRVASLVGPTLLTIPKAVAAFAASFPDVRVSLQTRTSDVVRDWARDDILDLGVTESTFDENIKVLEEFKMECILAIPEGHRLQEKDEVTPLDLIGEQIIALRPDHPTSAQIRSAFESYSRRFEPDCETYLFGPLCGMVASGYGVGITDPISARLYKNCGLVFRRFSPRITFSLMLISPRLKEESRSTSALRKLITEQVHKDMAVEELLT